MDCELRSPFEFVYDVDVDVNNLWCAVRYGPLDGKGHLRGGRFGSHAVTDFEVVQMIADVERQDLLSVFTDDKTLTYDEEVQFACCEFV